MKKIIALLIEGTHEELIAGFKDWFKKRWGYNPYPQKLQPSTFTC